MEGKIMMISREIIEEIRQRNDIVELIGSYVNLKRAGSNYNGLCPYHSEKSPSFTVFPGTQSFYCFGCGAGGDAITFAMRSENLDYPAAIEFLARRAGITISVEEEKQDGIGKFLTVNKSCLLIFAGIKGCFIGKDRLSFFSVKNEITIYNDNIFASQTQ